MIIIQNDIQVETGYFSPFLLLFALLCFGHSGSMFYGNELKCNGQTMLMRKSMNATSSMVNEIDGKIKEFERSEYPRAFCLPKQTFVRNFCSFANNFAVLIRLVFQTQECEPLIKKHVFISSLTRKERESKNS